MFGVVTFSSFGLGASNPFGLILVLGFAVVLVIVGALLIRSIRRWYLDTERSATESSGFSLHELRELRAEGRITQEEYDAARLIIIGSSATKAAGDSKIEEQTQELPEG